MRRTLLALSLVLSPLASVQAESFAQRVAEASVGDHRSEANIARNTHRHPVETLEFFGFDETSDLLLFGCG